MNVKIVQAFVESGRILQICLYLHTENHPHSKILLKEYAIEWLGRKRRLKETTRTTYLKFLELCILPVLGKLKVSEITVTDVQRMLDKHSLRHSYLTYAVGVTTDFKTIQGISGHADVFTLVNRYAHPQEDKVIDLTNKIANVLTGNSQK